MLPENKYNSTNLEGCLNGIMKTALQVAKTEVAKLLKK
jgi:hypothetical protein